MSPPASKQHAKTSESGRYVITPLAVGEYRITITANRFRSAVQEKVIVDALTTVSLNVSLQVGSTTDQVTVSDTPPTLQTSDARLGQTVRNEEYSSLPLAMGSGQPRNPTSFVFLMPGVTNTSRWGNTLGARKISPMTYMLTASP